MDTSDDGTHENGSAPSWLYPSLSAGLLLIGVALRLYQLDERSLWLDEYTSIEVATKSLLGIIAADGFDSHTPPLYYLLLHGWFEVFPADAWNLRLFSLVFDFFNILLLYRITRKQFSSRIALTSIFIYALSSYAIYYAQEGRMYTLLVFLVLLTYGLARLHATGGIAPFLTWFLLSIIGTLGMYTHYYYAFSLVGISLLVLFFSWRRFLSWFCGLFSVALFFTPWIFVVLGLLQSGGQSFRKFTFSVLPYTFFRFSAGYGVMPLTPELKSDMSRTISDYAFLLGLFGVPFSVMALLGLLRPLASQKDSPVTAKNLMWILLPLLFPPLVATLVSLKIPMLSERYLIVSFPFFVILLSTGIASRKLYEIAISGLLIFALSQHYFNPSFGNTPWKGAIQVLKQDPATVIVNPPFIKGLVEYYLENPAYPLRAERGFTEELEDLQKAGIETSSLWLIERGTAKTIHPQLRELGYALSQEEFFPLENGIRTYRLIKVTQTVPDEISPQRPGSP